MILNIRDHYFSMDIVKYFHKENHPERGYQYVVYFKDGTNICVPVYEQSSHRIEKVN